MTIILRYAAKNLFVDRVAKLWKKIRTIIFKRSQITLKGYVPAGWPDWAATPSERRTLPFGGCARRGNLTCFNVSRLAERTKSARMIMLSVL
jgi:hypothetical protein